MNTINIYSSTINPPVLPEFSRAYQFDVRDVIERFEELEKEQEALVEEIDTEHEHLSRFVDENDQPIERIEICPGVSDTLDLAKRRHVEAIEAERQWRVENAAEFHALRDLLGEVQGKGGDEQWRGDWYPMSFIRDDYFTEYARELLDECGELPRNLPEYIEIDWDATARNIRADYSSIEVDGRLFWYR